MLWEKLDIGSWWFITLSLAMIGVLVLLVELGLVPRI